MANDLNRSIKIYIDGSEATDSVAKVENAIQRLKDKLASLNKGEEDYAKKSKALQDELTRKNRTLEDYKKKITETERVLSNLSGATYQELLAVQRQVRKELQNAVPGTERYNVALEQNRRVTKQIIAAQQAMRVEVGAQGTVWLRASNFINQYVGMIGTAAAAITGITLKLNQLRQARNQREEAKADVQALTGLDTESIRWLEEQAKQMSTTMDESGIRIRQSATEILDAYKLVGSAKPELLEDKEALNAVTKETLILAQASGMQLKDAVDAVTLSLNQYGAGADQAARYTNVMAAGSKYGSAAVESITAALRNSGVAAASANVSIEQTVGMIETLAEKGIKDEVAGTGLKKFFLTLQTGADDTNPKIVGLSTAIENLAAKQMDAAEIKKMFGEEGYNVASVLINETEKVQYYTEAVTGTGVAIEQAGIKSNTAAAKLDQAKNKMQEMGIELMEKLNPALVSAANGLVNWTQKGVQVVDFIVRNINLISKLSAAIAAYVLICKAEVLEEKAKVFWKERVIVTSKRLYATLIKHPYLALAAVVVAFIAHLRDMNRTMTDSERIARNLNDIQRKAAEVTSNERKELEQLLAVARNENKSKAEREAAIRRINELAPDYLGHLTTETINTKEATDAVNRYVESMLTLNKIKQAQSRIDELNATKETIRKEGVDTSLWEDIQAGAANMALQFDRSLNLIPSSWATETVNAYVNKGVNELRAIDKEIEALNQHIEEGRQKLISLEAEKTNTELQPTTVTASDKPDKTAKQPTPEEIAAEELKKKLESEKALYEQHQMELKELFASGKDENLQTEADYNEAMEQLTLMHLQRMLEISGLDADKQRQIEQQLLDFKVKCRQELLKDTERKQEEELKLSAQKAEQEKRNAEKTEQAIRQKFENMKGYSQQFGEALGNVISGQEDAMTALGNVMIDIVFQYLEKLVDAWITELAGKAIKETASAEMTEIGSKGLLGLGTGAALAATIAGLLAAAKAGLKGIISKKSSSDIQNTTTSSTADSYTRVPTVSQHYAGKYDVIGEMDGRKYRGVPYIGTPPSGIVSSPALISESGSELIVNANDLQRLKRHINYPLIVQAINEVRGVGSVRQHVEGQYTAVATSSAPATNYTLPSVLLERLAIVLESIERDGIPASVALSELDRKQQLRDRSRKIGSKR